jgi:hypothetical protein
VGAAAAGATGILLLSGVLALGGLAVGGYWATHGDQAIGQTARGTFHGQQRRVADPVLRLGRRSEPYGVFLAGNDVFVGQESVIRSAECRSVIGMGTSADKLETRVTVTRVSPPFRDREDALKWYQDNMVPGSRHPRPLGLGTVARFKFDGKEHQIDNAERF